MKKVSILGSTGSIGVNSLSVIDYHSDKYDVFALSAHHNIKLLFAQTQKYKPKIVVLSDETRLDEFYALLKQSDYFPEILVGSQNLSEIAINCEVDIVIAAIVGIAGLLPIMNAARNGKKILIANKEALVVAGDLLIETVSMNKSKLIPIDSEHNAIHQCINAKTDPFESINELILTASGGPFRNMSIEQLNDVTPEQACHHPNWKMGKKISVDSATMMNKGLELIEAHYLFSIPIDKIKIYLHPQSVIHSMVQYIDGSIIAQMGCSDMKIPIAYALGWPKRIHSGAENLNFLKLDALTFDEIDNHLFPCLSLAYQAMKTGGTATLALNAANEIAVQAFLDYKIQFKDIFYIISDILSIYSLKEINVIEELLIEDLVIRDLTKKQIKKYTQ